MSDKDNNQRVIDLVVVAKTLWAKRKTFYIIWTVTFILSCVWILAQPRYYQCDVVLAPESSGTNISGGIASLASSFGVLLGDASKDALYPTLYPEIFDSPEFMVDLLSIQIETLEEDIHCDYYTYLKDYQKKNWLTKPFRNANKAISNFLAPQKAIKGKYDQGEQLNPFFLSKEDHLLLEDLQENIDCNINKQTSVITISVRDQDKLACAVLADSIRIRLQSFITDYRTQKARQDESYYKHLTDSAFLQYSAAAVQYSSFCDAHRKSSTQTVTEEKNRIKNELDYRLQVYNGFNAHYQATKAKVQERTPSFTTLKSATVPQKPAGPKRMIFVLGMLAFVTVVAIFWLARKELFL